MITVEELRTIVGEMRTLGVVRLQSGNDVIELAPLAPPVSVPAETVESKAVLLARKEAADKRQEKLLYAAAEGFDPEDAE